MVFRGLGHKVNEALGNLTYTPLVSSGTDELRVQVTDMDAKGLGYSGGYTFHTGSLNISILSRESQSGQGGNRASKDLCIKAVGLCVPETIAYGAVFTLVLLLLLSPLLYPVARSGLK